MSSLSNRDDLFWVFKDDEFKNLSKISLMLLFTINLLAYIIRRFGFVVLTGLLVTYIYSMAKYGNVSSDWGWLVFIFGNFIFLMLVDLRRVYVLGEEDWMTKKEASAIALFGFVVSAITLMLLV